MEPVSAATRIKQNKLRKRKILADQKQKWSVQKRENVENRDTGKTNIKEVSNATLRKRKQKELEKQKQMGNRERKQKQRERQDYLKTEIERKKSLKRERQKRWRENKNSSKETEKDDGNQLKMTTKYEFPNRMFKCRQLKKLKSCLPKSPAKRAATINAYFNTTSPTIDILEEDKIICTPADKLAATVVENIKDTIKKSKHRRSDEARAAVNLITASASGENISSSRAKKSLAIALDVSQKRISRATSYKKNILHSENAPYIYTKRKTRCAINEEQKRLMYDFWCSPENSHPTGNKNDVKRVRLGPKRYSSHPVHILEKTQTEVFDDFKQAHPNIKVSQRVFERCKPFFVRAANKKDRVTCCCRYHLEIKYVFKSVMDYRRKLNSVRDETGQIKIYKDIYQLCNDSLCEKSVENMHLKLCLDRKCNDCGISHFNVDPEELSANDDLPDVNWKCFEYKEIKTKNGQKRKLMLIQKIRKPGSMMRYFLNLLEKFPSHMFRARWQNSELKSLVKNLPLHHCITVHDFSENYKCKEQTEIQSDYFQKQEVSIHVTLIYRYSVFEIDGIESTHDNPHVITEHFFVISEDERHDHYFTHHVQNLVADYLKSISCKVDVMHEFCDGCASQYKSRHCLGDLSNSFRSFGYRKIVRNFFETAHAKGPQDAAGGFVKNQADLSVVRGKVIIQSGKYLFDFCKRNLTQPKSDKCKRRIFNYVDNIPRTEPRQYKPIPAIRSIHQAVAIQKGDISVRSLSCYSCEPCLAESNNPCENVKYIDKFVTYKVLQDTTGTISSMDEEVDERLSLSDVVRKDSIFAVLCDDENSDFYLVRAKSDMTILKKDKTDSWGVRFPEGSEVLEGNYYNPVNGHPSNYTLIRRKPAIIPAASVVFVCSDDDFEQLNEGVVRLFDETRQTIIDCVKMCDYVR